MSHNNKKYQRETPRRFFVKKSKTSNFGKKNTNYININIQDDILPKGWAIHMKCHDIVCEIERILYI